MDEIMAIAEKHNLHVIEDTAQGIGGDYHSSDHSTRKTGTIGRIGTTSFFPSKNLGCYGDGGAVFTNDEELAQLLKMVANHGQKKRYYHELVGCNSRLDTVQAAILKIKLKHLDEYINARRAVADRYDKAFDGHPKLRVPFRAPYGRHVFHQYTLLVENGDQSGEYRNGLKEFLENQGIPSMIYYPVPGHRQKMFEYFNAASQSLPVTDWLTERVISLPVHTEMDPDQQEFIISKLLEYVNR